MTKTEIKTKLEENNSKINAVIEEQQNLQNRMAKNKMVLDGNLKKSRIPVLAMIGCVVGVAVAAILQQWIVCGIFVGLTAASNVAGLYLLAKDSNLENENILFNQQHQQLEGQKQLILENNKTLTETMDNIKDDTENLNIESVEVMHSREYSNYIKYKNSQKQKPQTEQEIEDIELLVK